MDKGEKGGSHSSRTNKTGWFVDLFDSIATNGWEFFDLQNRSMKNLQKKNMNESFSYRRMPEQKK